MGSVYIEQPPADTPAALAEYLNRAFTLINLELNANNQLTPLRALPQRPKIGAIYYFSNAIAAHPVITAEGYYGYLSTDSYTLIAS